MTPAMKPSEIGLFSAFCAGAHSYVEFGCGGSTVLAAGLVRGQIKVVDSDPKWLDNVKKACAAAALQQPQTIYVDIGPVGAFGYPVDENKRSSWPLYHGAVWEDIRTHSADLYLIDGRFRVACLLQTLLHSRAQASIIIHDYWSRPNYQVAERFAHLICRTEDMAVLTPKLGFPRDEALAMLQHYSYDPA